MITDIHGRLLSIEAISGETGQALHQFASELYPIHRAVTGAGVRATLRAIARRVPLEIREVPTGQAVLDWQVPDEWEIRDAFIEHSDGHKVIDLADSNLHVVSYSVGVDRQMTWEELNPHMHTLPDHPDWIPYRTAHFQSRWGFCSSHHDWQLLHERSPAKPFRVRIDAEQKPGVLNWGEVYLPGQRDEEFLIATHICHPSLANDNLSGIVVVTELARRLAALPERPISFRFLFLPATIGAITWLAENRSALSRVAGGLVLANLGDPGSFTYKTSRQQTALIDQTVTSVLKRSTTGAQVRDFTPWGYDERQFCSPGFNLPMGRLTRTPDGEYPQYHTSADDLTLIQPQCLAESLQTVSEIISEFSQLKQLGGAFSCGSEFQLKLETNDPCDIRPPKDTTKDFYCEPIAANDIYVNLRPFGEPKLDRYGLYRGYGQTQDISVKQAVMWSLNLSDGRHTFNDIAGRSGLNANVLQFAIKELVSCGLLKKID